MVTHWGIDSFQKADDTLLDCVIKNYGKPSFWGRYLSTISDVSEGLTNDEVLFLHQNGIRILPIYNNFYSSVGFSNGKIAGKNAVYLATKLKIPKGKILFAHVEQSFEIDHFWIQGWFESLHRSGYYLGFYHDPLVGNFNREFCKAAKISHGLTENSILWSTKPEAGVSKMEMTPSFHPETLSCSPNTLAWQYGRNASRCSINTNLVTDELYSLLY